MRFREQIEQSENETLAPWGLRSSESLGRLHAQPEHAYRTAFQRDRDRILHSSAFRRLQYKTQVFSYVEGDHFRNRLTHTLEVAQIGRTIARALGANEDLTEAIVLAHDLGHPPFGHAGERVLHELLEEVGGFEHNRQSLRLVDWLEARSDAYRGLNLTHETRAGLLKHGVDFPRYGHPVPLPALDASPSVEAQIANLADEIAYHAHDLDDGVRSGLLDWKQASEVALVREARERGSADGASARVQRARVVVDLIERMTSDLLEASWARLSTSGIRRASDVRARAEPVLGFSAAMSAAIRELAEFLHAHFYRHPQIAQHTAHARRVLEALWQAYVERPETLPEHVLASAPDDQPGARTLGDYLAGMTDRFALDEHARLGAGAAPG